MTGAATFNLAPSAGGGPGTLTIPAINGGATSSITKSNAGTMVLNASGTYGGGSTVNAGVLRANGMGSLGTGPITLNGGTLRLGSQTEAPLVNFGGFQLNDGATLASNVLTLTTTAASQARSAFYTTPQDVSKGFSTTFVYKDTPNSATNNADGITFTIHNAQLGAGALGGSGGSLGYGGIANSGAVELNVYTGAGGGVGTSFGTNGAIVANQTTAPVNLASGDPIQIQLAYDPNFQTLSENLSDQTTGAASTITYTGVNFSSLLGGNVGYVGFTGGTGGQNATQTVSNFGFTGASANPSLASWNNAVSVTSAQAATIDVASASNGNNARLGTLAMGDASVLKVTGSTLASNAPYSLTLGATTLTGNATFDVANNGAGDGTLALGNITGTASNVNKTNNGILLLAGSGTSTFGIGTVNAGLLRVNTHLSATILSINSGGALGGKGTIDGPVNIASGGMLAPSQRAGGLIGGPLTITGPITLADNTSSLGILLASPAAPGIGYDQIAFGNTALLGGANLLLNDSTYAPNAVKGDSFWIMDGTTGSTPVGGELSYAGLPLADSSSFTGPNGISYEINYNVTGDPNASGHDVLLTSETNAVPEPASLSLLGLGAIGLLSRRRRRRA